MYIVSLTYVCELSAIDAYLEAHVAYLKEQYAQGHFLASGRKNPRTGGVILAKAASREELASILEKDPFHREKLATYEVQEFFPTMVADGLESLLEFC